MNHDDANEESFKTNRLLGKNVATRSFAMVIPNNILLTVWHDINCD
ncbi:MAG: hypothetical protein ACTSVI_16660 [Promethearchaeota archaeon]